MDNDKKKITITIFGTEYKMLGAQSEEYVQNLAEKVDNIMREIARSNKRYTPAMVAVLTALNMADVLYKTQEELSAVTEKLEGLQGEMHRPFEQVKDMTQELEAVKEQYTKLQTEHTRTQIELGKLTREWAQVQRELEDTKTELDVSKDAIRDFQGKLFENQIELLKTKKELDEIKANKRPDKNHRR